MASLQATTTEVRPVGVAVLKQEYIIKDHERVLTVECIRDSDKRKLDITEKDDDNIDSEPKNPESKSEKLKEDVKNDDEPAYKKCKLNKKDKKLRGQNKNRGRTFHQERESLLCSHLLEGANKCPLDKCIYLHDTIDYLSKKPPDIAPVCPVYSLRGFCPRGITCRFGSGHINDQGQSIIDDINEQRWKENKMLHTKNFLSKDIQIDLRKRKYNFSKSEAVLAKIDKLKSKSKANQNKNENDKCNGVNEIFDTKSLGPVDDSDTIPLRSVEKKKIDWKDKLYLSPLTTVGNLPFRRICKEFGVDITCGEMAMAPSILQGSNQEWALIKRHGSEDLFGVQVCGNNPFVMAKCGQVLQDQAEIDFIDINLGCPIDLVYQQGSGSGLLRRENVLMTVIEAMNSVLNIPLTVKTRTGVYSDKNIAHSVIPKFCAAGVSLITVHGRSREQRYTRSADWDYIEQCAKIASPTPLFGNGDVLSYKDYIETRTKYPSVSGVMIGRGALIKPWIFTEIKEQRLWDISSSERFEILKKYVNYGLDHWGTDTKGVENTRRFLLEWLSFLHRYIPVGLLENPPQKINERPPFYHGRDELETLMASSNCADWIKISEMLLGPVPDGFNFLPKHKANSWK